MLKLKFHYFDHLMWRADSLEKTLMLRKIKGRRRRGRQRMRWLRGIPSSVDMGLSKRQEAVKAREAWRAAVPEVAKSRTRQRDWTTTCPWAPQLMRWERLYPTAQELQEAWVPFLGQEAPLEEEMATRPAFLPGKPHGQGSLAGYSPRGWKARNMTVRLSTPHARWVVSHPGNIPLLSRSSSCDTGLCSATI